MSSHLGSKIQTTGKSVLGIIGLYCCNRSDGKSTLWQSRHQDMLYPPFQTSRVSSYSRSPKQILARDCAKNSGGFDEVAGFGASKGDFIAKIEFTDNLYKPLHLYVSVKNRSDTLGGQDWPNSIAALETYAKTDNRQQDGEYI